jgi:hypothetical protein
MPTDFGLKRAKSFQQLLSKKMAQKPRTWVFFQKIKLNTFHGWALF